MPQTYPGTIVAAPARALDHLRHYAADDLTDGRRVLYVAANHEDGRASLAAIADILGPAQIRRRTISAGNLTLDTTTGGRLWIYPARGHAGRGLHVDTLIIACQLTEQRRIDLTPTLNATSNPHWYQVEQDQQTCR